MKLRTFARALALGAVIAAGLATAALADNLLGGYWAYIGRDDLYNSNGQRLTSAVQILRQDRANLHRFGTSQAGDEWDPWFGTYEAREAIDWLVRNGNIGGRAENVLLNGGGSVYVKVYGNNAGALTKLRVSLTP